MLSIYVQSIFAIVKFRLRISVRGRSWYEFLLKGRDFTTSLRSENLVVRENGSLEIDLKSYRNHWILLKLGLDGFV